MALNKKSGGVRPIAVGCTLRRLVAKVAGFSVVDDMAALLAPRQLGYGVRGGAEAAVHAARSFLSDMDPDAAMVKLDFSNAFNSIRRDCMHPPSTHLSIQHTQLLHRCVRVTEPSPQLKGFSREIPWALSCFASPFTTSLCS